MFRPSFIHALLVVTVLLVRLCYAQNTEVLSSQPMIHGEINGMKVMAQGDAVAFMAASHYAMKLDEEGCARDLHCAMQKNRTEAVVLSPEGLWIYDSPPKQLPDNVIITEPLYPVWTEMDRLSNTAIEPTPTHIPLEFPQPTATLHTGNEVIDKTPGILLVSSPVMTWLAETVTTVSHSRQAMDVDESLSPIIEPTLTQQRVMLTTITEEEDELLRKLTSTSTMPMPTPTLVENRMWEDDLVRLEMKTDILTIRPSPSSQYLSNNATVSSITFSGKQVPTVTEGSTSGNRETTSTASDSTSTDSPQASNLPASTNQGVEGVTTAVQAMSLGAKSDTQDESEQATNIAAPPKYSTAEKRRILGGELRFSCDLLPKLSNEQLEKLFPDDYFDDPIKFDANLTIEDKKARLRIAGRGFIVDEDRDDSQLEESYAREFKCYVPESTIRRRVAREQARKELAEKLASGTNKYTTAQKRQMLMDRYLILEAERWDDEMIELLFPDHVLDDLNGFEKFVSIQEKEERLRLVNGDADVDSTLRYAERTGKAVEEAINVDYGYAFNTIRSIPPVLYLPKGFGVNVFIGSNAEGTGRGEGLVFYFYPELGNLPIEYFDDLKEKFVREWKARYPQDHPSPTTSINEVD